MASRLPTLSVWRRTRYRKCSPLPQPPQRRNHSLRQEAVAVKQPRKGSSTSAHKLSEQDNLLGILLGLIEGKNTPEMAAKPAASSLQTMDELIAKISADQRQRSEQERETFKNIADRKTDEAAQEGRQKLRQQLKL